MHGSRPAVKLGTLAAAMAAAVILLLASGSGAAAPIGHRVGGGPGTNSQADTGCNQATVSYDYGYACISVISDPERILCMSSQGKTGPSGYIRMKPCNKHSPDQEWGAFTVPGVYGSELWNVGESCPHHGLYGGLIHCATPFGPTSEMRGHGYCLRVLTDRVDNAERLMMSPCPAMSNASQVTRNKPFGWDILTTRTKGYSDVGVGCSYVNGCPGPPARKFWFTSESDTRNAVIRIGTARRGFGLADTFYGQVLHWGGSGTGLGCTKPTSKGC